VKIEKVIWLEFFVDKLAAKHNVTTQEAEEILLSNPHIRRAAKGHIKGEHVYAAYGQTESGRYLIVFFIYKGQGAALPISGHDMTTREQGYYDEQNEAGRSSS
jgi:uncharacterized protein